MCFPVYINLRSVGCVLWDFVCVCVGQHWYWFIQLTRPVPFTIKHTPCVRSVTMGHKEAAWLSRLIWAYDPSLSYTVSTTEPWFISQYSYYQLLYLWFPGGRKGDPDPSSNGCYHKSYTWLFLKNNSQWKHLRVKQPLIFLLLSSLKTQGPYLVIFT